MINPIRPGARLCDFAEVYFALSVLLAAASVVNSLVLITRL
jgi:hypothetical protein